MENPVLLSSCVTPAGTSIEVQNEWEENTHTHTHKYTYIHKYINIHIYINEPVAPVAQRYNVTSDTLGREFDPGKRDFSR